MAIAVNGGHVARARDFFHTVGKYFIIGGTTPWDNETLPDSPSINDFKLRDVIGLKRVDRINFVVPLLEGMEERDSDIQYRSQRWRVVEEEILTTIGSAGVTSGSNVISVTSVGGLTKGSKVRVNNLYEGTILSISGTMLTLDTAAPSEIPAGSIVLAGAEVEGAKYIYLDCYLNYNDFPVGDAYAYRQIGLCTGVKPETSDILLSKGIDGRVQDDYTSLGVLEILDNRVPSTRDINQREQLSLIIEF